MTRPQRRGHFFLWLILAPALLTAAIALTLHAPEPVAPPTDATAEGANP